MTLFFYSLTVVNIFLFWQNLNNFALQRKFYKKNHYIFWVLGALLTFTVFTLKVLFLLFLFCVVFYADFLSIYQTLFLLIYLCFCLFFIVSLFVNYFGSPMDSLSLFKVLGEWGNKIQVMWYVVAILLVTLALLVHG